MTARSRKPVVHLKSRPPGLGSCVAGIGRGQKRDGLCGERAAHQVAGIELCDLHYAALEQWREERALKDLSRQEAAFRDAARRVRRAAAELHEANRNYARMAADEIEEREAALAEHSVVYYLRRVSDGMIKIGTTTAFWSRFSQHRHDHGELQILLIRGGGRREEGDAHAKYREFRAGREEWFYPAQPLLRSIYRYRQGWLTEGRQPEDALGMEEFKRLVREAPPRKILQWDDDGVLQWPPVMDDAA